jgi:hypothetical protein
MAARFALSLSKLSVRLERWAGEGPTVPVADAGAAPAGHTPTARNGQPSCSVTSKVNSTSWPAARLRYPWTRTAEEWVQQPPGVAVESTTPHPPSACQTRTVPSDVMQPSSGVGPDPSRGA